MLGVNSGASASTLGTFLRWSCMSGASRSRRFKLGVTDIETGARAPVVLTRQAVPRQPAPQIPQVPGGSARAESLPRCNRCAQDDIISGARARPQLCKVYWTKCIGVKGADFAEIQGEIRLVLQHFLKLMQQSPE